MMHYFNKNENLNNIDKKEINKFNLNYKCWWNKNGILKLLHNIHELHLEYILENSNGIFEKKILDVGCGGGIFTEMMFKEGAIVTGLDVNKKLINIAKLHASKYNLFIKYLHETVESHILRNRNSYDIVTCMEVLEHVTEWKSLLISCLGLLKSGGKLFISTINRTFKSWIFIILLAENIFNIIPKGTHDIKKLIKPSEILDVFNNFIIKDKGIIGIKYNLILDYFYFSENVDTNYVLYIEKK